MFLFDKDFPLFWVKVFVRYIGVSVQDDVFLAEDLGEGSLFYRFELFH